MEDSSSSDDSKLEEVTFNDDIVQMLVMLSTKELEDKKKKRSGSQVGHIIASSRTACLGITCSCKTTLLMYQPIRHIYFVAGIECGVLFFVKIVKTCEEKRWYFKRKKNASRLLGFSVYQKILVAMRVLSYGIPANYADEYPRIGEDKTIKLVRRFCKVMIHVFEPK
jgi:hypothetical protein